MCIVVKNVDEGRNMVGFPSVYENVCNKHNVDEGRNMVVGFPSVYVNLCSKHRP